MNSTSQANEIPGPHLDRWHYLDYRDQHHDQNYIEWKYFNFVQDGILGYIIYYVLDPERNTHLAGGRIMIRIFKDGKWHGALAKVPLEAIQFDSLSANVSMGPARITESDGYHYVLSGSADSFGWQLTFTQHAPTIVSYEDTNPGLMRWERMNWLVKMPQAKVSGVLKIGSEQINIDALGYSDTNWGEIMPFFSQYEWGQINLPDCSMVWGALCKFGKIKNSYAYFTHEGKMIALENTACTIQHTQWIKDPSTGMRIPAASEFCFRDKEYKLSFKTKHKNYDLLGIKVLKILPTSVVIEQVVEYEVSIEKNGHVINTFSGLGFEESSDRTYARIPILF